MTGAPSVSIVIPTFNAGVRLARLLDAIAAQSTVCARRVIAVDSGSTDGTLDVLRTRGAEVVQLAPGSFNHGTSRNEGLSRAAGEFAVLIVQDALPASDRWLDALIAPLLDDAAVAGSFARQQPWAEASPLTAHYLSSWIACQAEPRVVGPLSAETFGAMSPAERHRACAFDNVCSCIRIPVWRKHAFRPTPIAEDLEWARDILLDGFKLAYAPEAVVWHSHDRPASYELQRTYLVHQRLQALFGLSTIPTAGSLVRAFASTMPAHLRIAMQRPSGGGVARAAALAIALPLGQYLGARAAREGREFLRTRHI